jgi:hypothetical protein
MSVNVGIPSNEVVRNARAVLFGKIDERMASRRFALSLLLRAFARTIWRSP